MLAVKNVQEQVEVEEIDIDAEVEHIRSLYYGVHDNLQAYSKHESNGIVYYFDEDTPV